MSHKYQPRINVFRGEHRIKDVWLQTTFGNNYKLIWNGHSHFAQDINTKQLYYIFKRDKKLIPITDFWWYYPQYCKGDKVQ